MMNKGMLKLISCILTLNLFLGVCWAGLPALAAGASGIKFDNPYVNGLFGFGNETSIKYGTSASSGKWTITRNSGQDYSRTVPIVEFASNGVENNWSTYKYLNLRVYSAQSNGAVINIVAYTNNYTSGNDGHVRQQFTLNWDSSWKTISLPLDSFTLTRTDNPWTNMKGLIFDNGGWQTTLIEGSVLYFDEIWLSEASASGDASATIADFNDPSTCSVFGFTNETTIVNPPGTNSGRWSPTPDAGNSSDEVLFSENGIERDWSKYNYLNLRVYSGKSNFSQVNVLIYMQDQVTAGRDAYWYQRIRLDWEGSWNIISLPLSDFLEGWGANSWSKMKSMRFNQGGWQTTFDETTVIYFDEIWLSTEQPESNTPTPTPDDQDQAAGMVVLAKFDSVESVHAVSNILTADTEIKRMYDVSAKWSNTTTNVDFKTPDKVKTDIRGYTALNPWVYSKKATGSTINVIAYCPTPSAPNAYYYTTFNVDWVGWRLLSLPLSKFNMAYNPSWQYSTNVMYSATGWGVTNASPETELNFEKIWYASSDIHQLTMTGSYPADRFDDMAINQHQIKLEFNNPLADTEEKNIVTVTKGASAPFNDYTISTEGNLLVINFTNTLEPSTAYTISLNKGFFDLYGQQYEKTESIGLVTMAQDFISDVPQFDTGSLSSGLLTAYSAVKNMAQQPKKAAMFLMVYDSGGKMIAYEQKEYTISASSAVDISASVALTNYTGCSARALVCDVTAGKPELARSEFAELTSAGETIIHGGNRAVGNNPIVTIDSAQFGLEKFRMSGRVSGGFPTILVTTVNDDRDYTLIVPLTVGDDGLFEYEYTLNPASDKGGEQVIEAGGRKVKNAAVKNAYYTNDTQRANILQQINDARTVSDVLSIIKTSAYALGIEAFLSDNTLLGHISLALFEYGKYSSYSGYSDIIGTINSALDTLEQLNNSTWLELTDILKSNRDMMLYGNTEVAYYFGLDQKAMNSINKTIASKVPFADFTAFRSEFDSAAVAYRNSLITTPSSGWSSGSKGGAGGASSNVTSSYGITAPTATAPAVTPQSIENEVIPEDKLFDDIDSVPWAQQSILELHLLNVISGDGDGKFRPNDNVKREEFVKMLIVSLDITVQDGYCDFIDAVLGDWYYPYLAAAKNIGVIEGNDDGSFGVGSNITRQDMAVMIYRALKLLDKTLPEVNGAILFDDDEFISGYSKEAVYSMQKAGIVSGMGNREFAPTESATRAQAAKMIYGMLAGINMIS